MAGTKKIARVLFIGLCGILNFIYLTVSTMVVFDKIFEILLWNKNAFSLTGVIQMLNTSSERIVYASADSIYFLPLYLVLVVLGFVTAVMFLYFMFEIPKIMALFYIERLDGFLFIQRKQTISFFIMILLPLANFFFLKVFAPGQIITGFIRTMILCTISHTGIFLFLLFMKAYKEVSYKPGDKNKIIKVLSANVIRAGLFILTAIFMILPYLLYYHYGTDINQAGVFHFFLISALISNFRFYKENFAELAPEME